jgi:hypothetical protein
MRKRASFTQINRSRKADSNRSWGQGEAAHAGLVGCGRGAVGGLLTPAVAALVGCHGGRGAVSGLLTPAVAALVGCRGAVGGLP